MIRPFHIALSACLFMAACAGPSDETADQQPSATSDLKDTSSLPDPFETLFPWDPAHEGIVTTESGLKYIIVHAGDPSGRKPGVNDEATVHYDGRLAADGTKFDASYDRGEPTTFGVSQVIPGWTEALQLMVPGDDWMVYLPSDIAYGERGTPGGPIGPNADLMFRVNLIDAIVDSTPGAEIFDTNLPWDSAAEGVETTQSGLQYKILAAGDANGPLATAGDQADMQFEIRTASNGRRLDSTFANGRSQKLGVASVFPGWSEALQLMRPGDDWLIYLPSELAFGERGTPGGPVGPNEDLLLRVNLVDILVPQISDSAAWDKYTPWDTNGPDVVKSDNGVEYVVLESGDAAGAMPTTASTVEVYYEGRLTTGETFDSAYARGESIEFPVTGVISGWTETLQKMRPGDRWLVYIPADKAYGDSPRPGGLIKPGDDLIFEMQLVGMR